MPGSKCASRHRDIQGTRARRAQKDLLNSQSPFPWPKAAFSTAQTWHEIYCLTSSNNPSKVEVSHHLPEKSVPAPHCLHHQKIFPGKMGSDPHSATQTLASTSKPCASRSLELLGSLWLPSRRYLLLPRAMDHLQVLSLNPDPQPASVQDIRSVPYPLWQPSTGQRTFMDLPNFPFFVLSTPISFSFPVARDIKRKQALYSSCLSVYLYSLKEKSF